VFGKGKARMRGCRHLQEDKNSCFSAKNVRHQDNLIQFYTGIANWNVFLQFFTFLLVRAGNTEDRILTWKKIISMSCVRGDLIA